MEAPPSCFISYSWDNEEHREWVRKLATRLRESGVDAILDQFHCPPGTDLTKFMEMSVRESRFVLIVCTENFARKADSGIGGVGYEKMIVTGEIFSGEVQETKFVPLLRQGEAKESLPSYLKNRLFIDFRDDGEFESGLEELLRHFHGEPLYQPPPIGSKPDWTKHQAPTPGQRSPHPQIIQNSIGMTFILMPAGHFVMGSQMSAEKIALRYGGESALYKCEYPSHEVTIKNAFYLQSTAVTQEQWKMVMGDNPSFFEGAGEDCPVENVSWDDAQRFIEKLKETEGVSEYRLPTEAEWEYACRAGTTTGFSFGDDARELGEYAWYKDNSKNTTHPVGQKKPNRWGLYDMHGNVWEWIEDDWHDGYNGAPNDGRAWIDLPRGSDRVIRGGGWCSDAQNCRSADRYYHEPGNRSNGIGFRLSRSITLGL